MPMIQRLSLSLALTLNWGTRMGSRNDPLFHEITEVEEEISKVGGPRNQCNTIPLTVS